MRETRADTRRAVGSALALHVLLFALMFAGMWWTRTAAPLSAAGPVIEADLIDPSALSAPMRRALDAPAGQPAPAEPAEALPPPPPQPEPAPRPDDAPVPPQPQAQEVVPEPDLREQERVEREAEAARQAAREQEERRRQQQTDLTEERKRQAEAEQKRRLAEQAREAKQKEIADKLARIRAEQAKADRQAKLAEQKLKQLEDARSRNAAEAAAQSDAAATASPPPGNGGPDADLAARYAAALRAAILRNWTRPDSVPLGQRCRIVIHQIPGGEVVDAKVDPSCPYDELGRRSIEAAVLKAQPLPYAGFETVFQRTLRLNFEAQDR